MAETGRFSYSGPPVRIVALDQEIEAGWEGEGPVELEAAAGFTRLDGPSESGGKRSRFRGGSADEPSQTPDSSEDEE